MNLLWNGCVVHRRRKFCWNTISAYFRYFGMIEPDIHLPKSPGISAELGRPLAPANRWVPMAPCHGEIQDRIQASTSMTVGHIGSLVLWFPVVPQLQLQVLFWTHQFISNMQWSQYLEKSFFGPARRTFSAGRVGGVDILSCKAWHSRGSIPVHPLHWISKTVSPMHMHRHVRKQRTSETKQGMK